MDIAQQPRYRKAILRIGKFNYNSFRHVSYFFLFILVLYPITSLVVNFIIVGLDLNSTIRGVHTELVRVTYV